MIAVVASRLSLCVCLGLVVASSQPEAAQSESRRETPPYWAYAINPPEQPAGERAAVEDKTPQRVPGSSVTFTLLEVADMFKVPDWHPSLHPPMPGIVAMGRKPEVFACGYCHLPNGQGRPENASLAGLPVGYILEQMADFKNGLRKSSDPRHKPVASMIAYETKASDEELQAAASYFSGIKLQPWIRVVETAQVPKTRVAGWMLIPSQPGGMEPIGRRIIEMPESLERTELRDDTSGFVAYVPSGSINKGKALVTGGANGRTVACGTCHGADLKGLGDVPSIAGRSPSYNVRQLFDIRGGARHGAKTQPMTPVVEKLTLDEMISIAAYTASLKP